MIDFSKIEQSADAIIQIAEEYKFAPPMVSLSYAENGQGVLWFLVASDDTKVSQKIVRFRRQLLEAELTYMLHPFPCTIVVEDQERHTPIPSTIKGNRLAAWHDMLEKALPLSSITHYASLNCGSMKINARYMQENMAMLRREFDALGFSNMHIASFAVDDKIGVCFVVNDEINIASVNDGEQRDSDAQVAAVARFKEQCEERCSAGPSSPGALYDLQVVKRFEVYCKARVQYYYAVTALVTKLACCAKWLAHMPNLSAIADAASFEAEKGVVLRQLESFNLYALSANLLGADVGLWERHKQNCMETQDLIEDIKKATTHDAGSVDQRIKQLQHHFMKSGQSALGQAFAVEFVRALEELRESLEPDVTSLALGYIKAFIRYCAPKCRDHYQTADIVTLSSFAELLQKTLVVLPLTSKFLAIYCAERDGMLTTLSQKIGCPVGMLRIVTFDVLNQGIKKEIAPAMQIQEEMIPFASISSLPLSWQLCAQRVQYRKIQCKEGAQAPSSPASKVELVTDIALPQHIPDSRGSA